MENKLKELILNLPKNKMYKREKIREVKIDLDDEDELQVKIETDFAAFLVGVSLYKGDVNIYGNIIETAYTEIDDMLTDSFDEMIVGEWSVNYEAKNMPSDEEILDEIISQMAQDTWKVRFKLLYKAYNTADKLSKECADEDIEWMLGEMMRMYFRR